ncbi:MAG: peptide chain release factor 1 [Deltaproteobacteria bacterium]|nr:peptide chain release factor 1 [Deltaproteobacteria bacterium]
MFTKLEKLVRRFEDINRQLSDPKVIGDNQLFQKLSKESSDLVEMVKAFKEYTEVQKDLEQNRELFNHEKDPEIKQMAKDEIPHLENRLKSIEEHIKILLLPKDPNDDKNVFLEIRAGTGGDEAGLFAADLFRMYQRYAESMRWQMEVIESSAGGIGGFKEIIIQVNGKNVYSGLKYEGGVHRVQRVPATEQQGRVHTSAVTVAVLPEADEVEVKIEEKDLRFDTFTASGPGGQHVNKTQSAVRYTHIPTGIVVACQEERSQHKNKARAMKLLKAKIYDKMLHDQQAEIAKNRKGMVGTGDRSDKIRTYNFPQNRLTDHRIGLTLYQLDKVMDGHLEEVISPLRTHFQSEALKGEIE